LRDRPRRDRDGAGGVSFVRGAGFVVLPAPQAAAALSSWDCRSGGRRGFRHDRAGRLLIEDEMNRALKVEIALAIAVLALFAAEFTVLLVIW
jgi:hypothetical protein